MKLREVTFDLALDSPAFLGNARQSAEWRTPPIKALLRQMWRLAVAPSLQFKEPAIRDCEARLFGAAAGAKGTRSAVVMRLAGAWSPGSLRQWPQQPQQPRVHHPEVQNRPIDAHLYLGYGPLGTQGLTRGPNRERTALAPSGPGATGPSDGRVTVCLRYPRECEAQLALDKVLVLLHLFGTLGGRSRNGWGSVRVENPKGVEVDQKLLTTLALADVGQWLRDQRYTRSLKDCLDKSWTHALGTDAKGLLVWRTKETQDGWSKVMQDLADVKIKVRAGEAGGLKKLDPGPSSRGERGSHGRGDDAGRHGGRPGPRDGRAEDVPSERHVLAYPVTNHLLRSWGNKFRMPNQLRFKVVREGEGKYRGYAFHLPWLPPGKKVPSDLAMAVWPKVHEKLDALCERVS